MTRPMSRWAGWPIRVLATTLLIAICGCSRTATVTGKVRYKGRPVTYGSVIFLSPDQTARSGVIQPDGSYKVEGVPPGPVKIGVLSRDPSKAHVHQGGKKTDQEKAAAKKIWFPLPLKFEDPASSGLSCTVGSGQGPHDIELE